MYSDGQTATEKYQHQIGANGEAAEKLTPEKTRKKADAKLERCRYLKQRTEVNEAFSEYKQTQTSEQQERLQIAKRLLQETYVGVEDMKREVERADER